MVSQTIKILKRLRARFLKCPGPILDIRGMGAFFGANIFKKGAFCLLVTPNQMSLLTISNENIFFENQGTRLGAIIAPNKV